LEGGPKVAELPKDFVDSKRLIEELNINPELPDNQRKKLQDIIVKNQRVFGLDNRLGHLDVKVQIPLKPEAKGVSLPPFHASPANQEVIDKQMDEGFNWGLLSLPRVFGPLPLLLFIEMGNLVWSLIIGN